MKSAAAVSDGAHQQFVAIVAHELRHPLVPIQNAAALLRRDSVDAATISLAAEIIEHQVSGMNRLIADLVDISRMQMGELELRLVRTPLSELMELLAETATPLANERGHGVSISVSPDPVYLNIDVVRIAQALHNIIGNASKLTDGLQHLHVHAKHEGAQAVIVVSNLRPGVATAEIDMIFDLEPGLGLGLYLARYLIEAHTGTISAVIAGPGHGSEFTVRMPCEATMPSSGERAGAEPAGDPSPA
jgi:signal transduction histidine kinase